MSNGRAFLSTRVKILAGERMPDDHKWDTGVQHKQRHDAKKREIGKF